MSFRFGKTSHWHLANTDSRLANVARRALEISKYDFGITCSIRTETEQAELVRSGASTTMKSRHLPNDNNESEAIDIVVYVNNTVTWESRYYRAVAAAFFQAAIELGIHIEWGGHWETFIDGPHYQLGE